MKRLIRLLIDAFFRLFYRLDVRGIANIPESNVILAPNHNHLLDPLLIGAIYRPDVTAVAKIELSDNAFFRAVFKPLDVITIDRDGRDLKSIRAAIETLDRMSLIIFPEGTRNPGQEPLPGKPGVPLMARQAKTAIVPVVISGSYRVFSRMTVEFLPPIRIEDYGYARLNSESYQAIADDILGRIYIRRQEISHENNHR